MVGDPFDLKNSWRWGGLGAGVLGIAEEESFLVRRSIWIPLGIESIRIRFGDQG